MPTQLQVPFALSERQLVLVSFVCILLIGLLDYFTGTTISLTVFYVFPIAFAAWFAGIRTGIVLAVVGTLIYLTGDIYMGEAISTAVAFWNATIRLAMFFVVLYCIAMLKRTQDQLRSSVTELESRNLEILVLAQIGEILQSCSNANEAYKVLERFCPRIFQNSAGALSVLDDAKTGVQVVFSWNQSTPVPGYFPADSCWAVRRGRAHVVTKSDVTVICEHVDAQIADDYVCVPLVAQGESLGVLTLIDVSSAEESLQPSNRNTKRRLTFALAEQIALTLSNLKMRDSLHIQATRDPLTGLFKRRYFIEAIAKQLQQTAAYKKCLSVILMDIDHFKKINDTFGHEAGDYVLRDVARLLQSQLGAEDFACRYGGEEFILIMPDCSIETAKDKAEQIRQLMKKRKIKYQEKLLENITMSTAVASTTEQTEFDQLLRAADAALYRAKAEGRDRVVAAL